MQEGYREIGRCNVGRALAGETVEPTPRNQAAIKRIAKKEHQPVPGQTSPPHQPTALHRRSDPPVELALDQSFPDHPLLLLELEQSAQREGQGQRPDLLRVIPISLSASITSICLYITSSSPSSSSRWQGLLDPPLLLLLLGLGVADCLIDGEDGAGCLSCGLKGVDFHQKRFPDE